MFAQSLLSYLRLSSADVLIKFIWRMLSFDISAASLFWMAVVDFLNEVGLETFPGGRNANSAWKCRKSTLYLLKLNLKKFDCNCSLWNVFSVIKLPARRIFQEQFYYEWLKVIEDKISVIRQSQWAITSTRISQRNRRNLHTLDCTI